MSDDTPWLSPAQLYNWVHLSATLTALPAAIEQQLKQDTGLNFYEYSVLAALSEAPGRAMQMSTLASSALGSASRLSHAVTRLERLGWVQRRNCRTGPRSIEAVLTDAGVAKITEAAPGHVRTVRHLVVDALSDEEFDQLQHALRKILQATSPATLEQLDQLFAGEEDPSAHEACRALAGLNTPQTNTPTQPDSDGDDHSECLEAS
ncbi:MarR family transcriptional regulator [Kineosporia rhizophila]|uniref:MarR family winged helix-turn-helix transcriptional regulator n=1 Tax=Kineosporia TaxID=49184 RepID=UPI001E2DD01A|nr:MULTISPECIES: MarR family transcriptional regulator [Kineosporia]MCE0539546.1 MarR family transcriptional regulator [Kineosporia rhizophila]GLY16482.1 hypothetical protein Kisp01_34970 [Kineosporia sp. NBRC 101677]